MAKLRQIWPVRPPPRRSGWFPFALVAAPLAVFFAILLAPTIGGGIPQSQAGSGQRAGASAAGAASRDAEQALFGICTGGARVTCVVDGDTIWYRGTKIRIADIDTPEVSRPGCPHEAMMGDLATRRLVDLLNEGPFTLEPNPDGSATDRYGRDLRVVTRDGRSLGDTLVAEGLAGQWGAGEVAWC
ncbi:thermonuclease family protein [Qipengyuania sp. JC766]|uniref:thermonuclease family protein n=1 Tax=Qipengyuania sp. JC766 TaxID=3232139 RepID=UPI0034581563